MAVRGLLLLLLTSEMSLAVAKPRTTEEQVPGEGERVGGEGAEVAEVAAVAVRAALAAKRALHAARVYFLIDPSGSLAHRKLLARALRATAAKGTLAAAVGAAAAAAESGAALVVMVAPHGGDQAQQALRQVPGWPGASAWLLVMPPDNDSSPAQPATVSPAGAMEGPEAAEAKRLAGAAARAFGAAGEVPPGGRVLVVDAQNTNQTVPALAVWKWEPNGPMAWCVLKHLTATAMADTWRAAKLEGATLRVTTLDYAPMMVFNDSRSPPLVDGFFGQLWLELERRLRFRTKWLKPLDGNWGSLRNGTWDGMVSQLLNGTAHVALNAFTITGTRLNAIQFSSVVINTRVCAFVGLAQGRAVEWQDYLRPFAPALWAAVWAAAAALAVALVALHALARRLGDPRAPPEPQCESPLAALFYVFGIFCQQGHDVTPESLSCRVVYLTAYITAVTLLAAYSAALIAFLSVVQVLLPFNNFQEMLDKRPPYRLGMAKSSGVLNAFDQAKDPLLRAVFRRLIAPGLHDLPADHAEVRRRLCATDRPYAYMRSQILGLRGGGGGGSGDCEVAAVPRVSLPEALALMLPKRSALRRLLNWHLQEMKQQGIHNRIMLTFWPKIVPLDENPFSTVGFENVLPVIAILSVGVAASVLLVLGEILVNRRVETSKLKYAEDKEENPQCNASNPASAELSRIPNEPYPTISARSRLSSSLAMREDLSKTHHNEEMNTERQKRTTETVQLESWRS